MTKAFIIHINIFLLEGKIYTLIYFRKYIYILPINCVFWNVFEMFSHLNYLFIYLFSSISQESRWLNFRLQNSRRARWARARSHFCVFLHMKNHRILSFIWLIPTQVGWFMMLRLSQRRAHKSSLLCDLCQAQGGKKPVRAPSGCPPCHAVVWSHLHHMAHIHKPLRERSLNASLCKWRCRDRWGPCIQGWNFSLRSLLCTQDGANKDTA